MSNGNECNPGGYHGLQSRCPDVNWEVGSIPTRFRNNYIFFIFVFFSFLFSQGMYVDKIDESIYSLNMNYNIFQGFEDINSNGVMDEYTDNNYGISLSTVLKGLHEISFNYSKEQDSKVLGTSYSYYIKPDFYFKMFSGLSYDYIQKKGNLIEHKYKARLGTYIRPNNSTGLQYFPFFIYDYILHDIPGNYNISSCMNCYYDILTIGCSLLFNDIGIEPSYSWIDSNTKEVSLKIYLWEFSN